MAACDARLALSRVGFACGIRSKSRQTRGQARAAHAGSRTLPCLGARAGTSGSKVSQPPAGPPPRSPARPSQYLKVSRTCGVEA